MFFTAKKRTVKVAYEPLCKGQFYAEVRGRESLQGAHWRVLEHISKACSAFQHVQMRVRMIYV